jgi:hypothetical protein
MLGSWPTVLMLPLLSRHGAGHRDIETKNVRYRIEAQDGWAGPPSPTDNGNLINFDGHSNLEILELSRISQESALFQPIKPCGVNQNLCSFFSLMTEICKLGLFHSTKTMKYISIGPAVIDLIMFNSNLPRG